jgi:hypothetical protein
MLDFLFAYVASWGAILPLLLYSVFCVLCLSPFSFLIKSVFQFRSDHPTVVPIKSISSFLSIPLVYNSRNDSNACFRNFTVILFYCKNCFSSQISPINQSSIPALPALRSLAEGSEVEGSINHLKTSRPLLNIHPPVSFFIAASWQGVVTHYQLKNYLIRPC